MTRRSSARASVLALHPLIELLVTGQAKPFRPPYGRKALAAAPATAAMARLASVAAITREALEVPCAQARILTPASANWSHSEKHLTCLPGHVERSATSLTA